VLIFDLVVWLVTKNFYPLLEYLCCITWYQSTFQDLLPLYIEIVNSYYHFFVFFYLSTFKGLEHYSITYGALVLVVTVFCFSKRFPFSQVMSILVISKGINPEYALLNLCRVYCDLFFLFCYSLIYVCSFPCPLCDINKS